MSSSLSCHLWGHISLHSQLNGGEIHFGSWFLEDSVHIWRLQGRKGMVEGLSQGELLNDSGQEAEKRKPRRELPLPGPTPSDHLRPTLTSEQRAEL